MRLSRDSLLAWWLGHASHDMTAFWLVVAFVACTCIDAPAGDYLWLQHVPTLVGLPILWWAIRSGWIDRIGVAGCLAFVILHAIGARWIYSYVPYDDGLQALFRTGTEELFGWTRNHYDRLVHLMYGVCFAPVAWQFHRVAGRRAIACGWLAIEWVLASSALYEIAEWLVAMLFAPDWADSYLGQQGDAWDPIKDMALAGVGSAAVASGLSLRAIFVGPRRGEPNLAAGKDH